MFVHTRNTRNNLSATFSAFGHLSFAEILASDEQIHRSFIKFDHILWAQRHCSGLHPQPCRTLQTTPILGPATCLVETLAPPMQALAHFSVGCKMLALPLVRVHSGPLALDFLVHQNLLEIKVPSHRTRHQAALHSSETPTQAQIRPPRIVSALVLPLPPL